MSRKKINRVPVVGGDSGKPNQPRNYDSCWVIQSIDDTGLVSGYRQDQMPPLPWFRLEAGHIKVFPRALVIITQESENRFKGELFLGVAVYEETTNLERQKKREEAREITVGEIAGQAPANVLV